MLGRAGRPRASRWRSTETDVAAGDRAGERAGQADLRQVADRAGHQRPQRRQGVVLGDARGHQQRAGHVGQRHHVVRGHHRRRVIERPSSRASAPASRPPMKCTSWRAAPDRLGVALDAEGGALPGSPRCPGHRSPRSAGAWCRRPPRAAAGRGQHLGGRAAARGVQHHLLAAQALARRRSRWAISWMRVSRTAMMITSQVDTSGGSSPVVRQHARGGAGRRATGPSAGRAGPPPAPPPAASAPARVVPTTPAPMTNTVGVGSENSSGSPRERCAGGGGGIGGGRRWSWCVEHSRIALFPGCSRAPRAAPAGRPARPARSRSRTSLELIAGMVTAVAPAAGEPRRARPR